MPGRCSFTLPRPRCRPTPAGGRQAAVFNPSRPITAQRGCLWRTRRLCPGESPGPAFRGTLDRASRPPLCRVSGVGSFSLFTTADIFMVAQRPYGVPSTPLEARIAAGRLRVDLRGVSRSWKRPAARASALMRFAALAPSLHYCFNRSKLDDARRAAPRCCRRDCARCCTLRRWVRFLSSISAHSHACGALTRGHLQSDSFRWLMLHHAWHRPWRDVRAILVWPGHDNLHLDAAGGRRQVYLHSSFVHSLYILGHPQRDARRVARRCDA